jgi:acetyl esterase
MSKALITLFVCLALQFGFTSAHAQVSALPPEIQQKLAAAGPKWRGSLEDTQPMYALFQPLLKASPKDGVKITKNLAYGSDPKQVFDVYQSSGKTGVPVLIFIHGGAYVRGSKNDGEMYGNIATWFARQGMLGINTDYPLAPAAMWPSGAQNVGRIVAWAKANATKYGGDQNHIILIGHSAGATHVASYIFDKSLQPTSGPGVAGAVLISGRYRVTYDPGDPNAKNVQAYFGEDTSAYVVRSPITHIRESSVPLFIVNAEYENFGLDVLGAELYEAVCKRDGRCPRYTRLEKHNHISEVATFNTADEQLGREILEFVKRGR